jgi:hypothetical protein
MLHVPTSWALDLTGLIGSKEWHASGMEFGLLECSTLHWEGLVKWGLECYYKNAQLEVEKTDLEEWRLDN